jgi:hypothetical protein
MILLRRCLECLKNYFHLWGLQKSLVARCPTRENNFFRLQLLHSNTTLLPCFIDVDENTAGSNDIAVHCQDSGES